MEIVNFIREKLVNVSKWKVISELRLKNELFARQRRESNDIGGSGG